MSATQLPDKLFGAATASDSSILRRFTLKKLLSVHLYDQSIEPDIRKRLRSVVYSATVHPPLQSSDKNALIREVAIKYQPIHNRSDEALITHELLMNHVLTTATTESVRTAVQARMHDPKAADAAERFRNEMLATECTNITRMFHWAVEKSNFATDFLYSVPSGSASTAAAWRKQQLDQLEEKIKTEVGSSYARDPDDPTTFSSLVVPPPASPSVVMVLELAELSLLDLLAQEQSGGGAPTYIKDDFLVPLLLQVLCTLHNLGVWRFSHLDLNIGNILLKKVPSQRFRYYVLNKDKTVLIDQASDYMCLLSDFGFSYAKFINGATGVLGAHESPLNRFPAAGTAIQYVPRYDLTVLGYSVVLYLLRLYTVNPNYAASTKQTLSFGLLMLEQCGHTEIVEAIKQIRALKSVFPSGSAAKFIGALRVSGFPFSVAQLCLQKGNENPIYDVITKSGVARIEPTSDVVGAPVFSQRCGDMTLRPLLAPKRRWMAEQEAQIIYSE
jgi:hypothetical protein